MKWRTQLILFTILLAACHLFYWLFLYPNPDEAYYWLFGLRPALSYHEHPALNAWIQGFFHTVFGRSLFVLRLPVLCTTAVMAVVYFKILHKLGKGTQTWPVLLLIFSTPLIFLFTSFAWQDHLMMAMGICAGYFWLNYLADRWQGTDGKTSDILLACTFLGLAALSKYNSVFIGLGMISVVLVNKRLHKVLKDWRIYLGGLLCLAILSPIIVWNASHGFSSMQSTLGDRTVANLQESAFAHGNVGGFIGGTILLLSPMVMIALFRLLWHIGEDKKQSMPGAYHQVYRKLAIHVFLWSTLTFLVLSTFSNVLYYWNLPAYLFLMPLAMAWLVSLSRKWVAATLTYSAIFNLGILLHFGILPFTAIIDASRDEDGAYYYGWAMIGDAVNSALEDAPPETQLLTSSYRTAALLSYRLDRSDIYEYSPNDNSFDHWTKDVAFEPGQNAIILTDDREVWNASLDEVLQEAAIIDTVRVERFGYFVKEYYLWRGEF